MKANRGNIDTDTNRWHAHRQKQTGKPIMTHIASLTRKKG